MLIQTLSHNKANFDYSSNHHVMASQITTLLGHSTAQILSTNPRQAHSLEHQRMENMSANLIKRNGTR
eukprot:5847195-Ditylum_brightwellii.AAC.1